MPPTAKQLVALVHVTALSATSVPPVGVGLGMIDHLVPSHRSIRVVAAIVVAPKVAAEPTAKQLVVLVHVTAPSSASPPLGLGLVTKFQLVPFQRSINVPLRSPPTPKQQRRGRARHAREVAGRRAGRARARDDRPVRRGGGRCHVRRDHARDQTDRRDEPDRVSRNSCRMSSPAHRSLFTLKAPHQWGNNRNERAICRTHSFE